MERMRVSAKRLVDGAVSGGDGRRAVDVERRAFGRRELVQRHAFTGQLAIDAMESVHEGSFY